jgi:uncharacterized membrane protein HdeD (DUF308 family)
MRLTNSSVSGDIPEVHRELRKNLGWAIALGILMMILGLVAIAKPFFATFASIVVLSWLFILGGIFLFVYTFQTRRFGYIFLKLLAGFIYLIVGIFLLENSIQGIISALGICIFLKGIFQIFLAFQLRPLPNWGWVLFSGILGIILAIIICSWNHTNSEEVIFTGILVGIDLLSDGLWMVLLSSAVHRILKK